MRKESPANPMNNVDSLIKNNEDIRKYASVDNCNMNIDSNEYSGMFFSQIKEDLRKQRDKHEYYILKKKKGNWIAYHSPLPTPVEGMKKTNRLRFLILTKLGI